MPNGAGGGGGGGIVGVGNTFTGPAEALELIGDHCYAYSGGVNVPDSETTLLNFTTGNYYSVVDIQVSSSDAAGDNYEFRMSMNGAEIMGEEFNNTYHNYPNGAQPWQLIIPPYTAFTLTLEAAANSAEWFATVTGRIYRG